MKTLLTSFLAFVTALSAAALSAADQRPAIISQRLPDYSFDLRRSHIEGEVLVSFTIDAMGDVVDAVVVRSSRPGFEAATLKAVKKWKFMPRTKDGTAVSTKVKQIVAFSIQPSATIDPPNSGVRFIASSQPAPAGK